MSSRRFTKRGAWDVTRPGYLEADSVAHCGASLAGDFIWSLTYTDIATQWTEGRAVRKVVVIPDKLVNIVVVE